MEKELFVKYYAPADNDVWKIYLLRKDKSRSVTLVLLQRASLLEYRYACQIPVQRIYLLQFKKVIEEGLRFNLSSTWQQTDRQTLRHDKNNQSL